MVEPLLIGIDPAGGLERSVIARLQAATGGTAIEIIELQRAIQPTVDRMAEILSRQMATGMAALSIGLIDSMPRIKEIPSWRFYKPVQAPQWDPPIKRPRQRSASMRKHARIVRSRMMPSERRRRQATWDRAKRQMAAAGIVNPKASKFWKDFFQ